MKLQLIRSATIKLIYDSCNLLTDPFFSEKYSIDSFAGYSRNPLIDLPISIDNIMHDIDGIIISHMHSDHFDHVAKNKINKNYTILCQPFDENEIRSIGFSNVIKIDQRINYKNIEIERFTVQHGYGAVLQEMGKVSGYKLRAKNEKDLYWLGDTVMNMKLKKMLNNEKPGIIVVHACGAVWGRQKSKIVFDEKQTIDLCKMLPESIIIAIHMDSLDHSTVSRKKLREYADKSKIDKEKLIIPEDGEIINLCGRYPSPSPNT